MKYGFQKKVRMTEPEHCGEKGGYGEKKKERRDGQDKRNVEYGMGRLETGF